MCKKMCANCCHWEPMRPKRRMGECMRITIGDDWCRDAAVIDANAADDTSLDARLITRSEFCCSEHRDRPDSDA